MPGLHLLSAGGFLRSTWRQISVGHWSVCERSSPCHSPAVWAKCCVSVSTFPHLPFCIFHHFVGKCFLWIIILYILKYLMLLFSSFSFYHNPGCQLIHVCISRVSSWRFLSVGIFLSKLSIQPYGYCAPQLLYGCKCSTLAPISIFHLLVLHSKRLPSFPVLLQFWSSLPSY